MTVKEFFKSKTLRCIVVLLCIALISGGLLAVCNDLLSVSAEERVQRTIKGIYGKTVGYQEIATDYQSEVGTVDSVYLLEDGNYLVRATGLKGYKQGSVSVWCVAYFENGSFKGLGSVSIAAYDKQTLMSKWTGSVLAGYQGKETFDVNVSGATYSSTAINNALNTVLGYVGTLTEVQHD